LKSVNTLFKIVAIILTTFITSVDVGKRF
jgi:hypothetical protein